MKCVCGMSYDEDSREDRARHRRFHGEYAKGPRVPALLRIEPIAVVQALPVRCIDESIESAISTKVAHVAMVAQREIGGKAGFYGGTPEQQLYVLGDGNRCVAMVFMALSNYQWALAWDDARPGRMRQTHHEAILQTLPVVARAWTAADYRGRGLAKGLLHVVMQARRLAPAGLAWELPFTANGERLARSIAPTTFLGSCEPYFLRLALEGERE